MQAQRHVGAVDRERLGHALAHALRRLRMVALKLLMRTRTSSALGERRAARI